MDLMVLSQTTPPLDHLGVCPVEPILMFNQVLGFSLDILFYLTEVVLLLCDFPVSLDNLNLSLQGKFFFSVFFQLISHFLLMLHFDLQRLVSQFDSELLFLDFHFSLVKFGVLMGRDLGRVGLFQVLAHYSGGVVL